jgi:hypothetical protein
MKGKSEAASCGIGIDWSHAVPGPVSIAKW